MKLRKIYDRYCAIKQSPIQFNKSNARLNSENLPKNLKSLLVNNETSIFGQSLNASKIYVTKPKNDNWSNLNVDEKIKRFQLMSYLKSVKQKALNNNTSTSTSIVDSLHGKQTNMDTLLDVTQNEPKLYRERVQYVLNYLGLKSIDDLFLDDEPITSECESSNHDDFIVVELQASEIYKHFIETNESDSESSDHDDFIAVEDQKEENLEAPLQQHQSNDNKPATESNSIIESQVLKIVFIPG